MSAMNAYRSRLSAKYWNRLPLATPARRAMTFRLPREKPCAPNSASAASITAARRAGSTRAHVTVGIGPPSVDDHWSFYGEPGHRQGAVRSSCVVHRYSVSPVWSRRQAYRVAEPHLREADVDGTPFGRYRLVALLGRGGMGEVWRAHDTARGRVVALKLLPADFADDPVFQERFRREAHAAAGIDEPHVVPIYDFGEIDGRLFVTMRLIKGRDLQTILTNGPLAPARAVAIIGQVAQAVYAAHKVGLVHRDIKPSNILLDDNDFAYLIDFGIARAAGQTGLTSTGAAIGTWSYMAPERFQSGTADTRADIYALACVLYEALTGQRPYPGDSLEQQIVGHLTSPPPRPSTLQPGVPGPLDAVIAKGMAKQPDRRYASTVELARAARDATTLPLPRPEPTVPV